MTHEEEWCDECDRPESECICTNDDPILAALVEEVIRFLPPPAWPDDERGLTDP